VVLAGGGVPFVPLFGLVVCGVEDGGFIVELGFVVEFGTVLGVLLGEFGAAFGVVLGTLGVTSGVAPGSVCMVEALGLVAAGGLVVPGVGFCELCDPIVLCELGLLDWPLIDPVVDDPVVDPPVLD
jgi:hypothetical protein